MIKCIECGFETDRLQWTHFKYKCTGKFSNPKEYKLMYPNAPLVSAKIINKTRITLENMIIKYGEIEGNNRWNQYKTKQAESNLFEYKQKKYGWTKKQFDEYNSARAQTLEKMINRYGEDQGTIKWIEYCERQSYTNTKEYFVDKYGIEKGTLKFLQLNKDKASSTNPKVLSQKLNISLDEAVDIILTRLSKNCDGNVWGSNIEKEFVSMLIDKVGTLEYTTFTKPYGRWSPILESYVIYDIKNKDCIIEFNGDYWHANPKIYKDDALIRGRTALEIQTRDYNKMKTAENFGFRTYTVWESDFKSNKEETIKRVVEWMQNGQK